MSKFLSVSTSGFYSYADRVESEQSKRKKEVKDQITEIYNESNQIYRAPKITHLLREEGHIISEKTVGNYTTASVLRAIDKAKSNRKLESPMIIPSDRDTQYVSKAYIEATPASNFIRSYSNKGNPWDNTVIESFHALIKREWLNRFVIQHLSHAHELVFEYIETFYNTKKIHSHCMMKSPYEYEEQYAI